MLAEPLIPSCQTKNSANGQSDPRPRRVNCGSLAGAILAPSLAYLVLMSITPLFAQTKSQQIAVGPSKPCSLPGIPPQRINEVVDTSHALPASLGSDAI